RRLFQRLFKTAAASMPTVALAALHEPPWLAFSGGSNRRDTPTEPPPIACFAV
ncbi:hypothetical protein PIB30_079153, partial [Stylosanthes scabra]|nr:hypothetical protein [Stylosanthes scabra]